jgi:hypothetical protein
MTRFKLPLTLVLVFFLVVDLFVALRLWIPGWPRVIALNSLQPGVAQVSVMAIPFTVMDWLILAVVGLVHTGLAILAWKAWRTSVHR